MQFTVCRKHAGTSATAGRTLVLKVAANQSQWTQTALSGAVSRVDFHLSCSAGHFVLLDAAVKKCISLCRRLHDAQKVNLPRRETNQKTINLLTFA